MPFMQIVYESLASDSLGEEEVLDILRKSQVRNNQAHVSGILVFCGGRFLQFLEGPPDQVEALYERIERDPRHHELRVLSRTDGEKLLMPTWAMAYASARKVANGDETFALNHRQAVAICELLPDHIGGPFLKLLASASEAT